MVNRHDPQGFPSFTAVGDRRIENGECSVLLLTMENFVGCANWQSGDSFQLKSFTAEIAEHAERDDRGRQ